MASTPEFFVPDKIALSGIPILIGRTIKEIIVITSNFTTCNIRLNLNAGFGIDSFFIRFELEERDKLKAIARLQTLLHEQAPAHILPVLEEGNTADEGCRTVAYMITPFLTDATNLEDVWNDLNSANQQILMNTALAVMQGLQGSPLLTQGIHRLQLELHGAADSDNVFLGSLDNAHHSGIKDLLLSHIRSSTCEIVDTREGFTVKSAFDDVASIAFTDTDIQSLRRQAVLCHNDLEPRNILVQKVQQANENDRPAYKLAAIIDWEQAGILPPVYEVAVKDTSLGLNNLYFSWYKLFRERVADRIEWNKSENKLMQAMRVIVESEQRSMKRNVGVRFRQQWIKREQLVLSEKMDEGWSRKPGAENMRPFTKCDNEKMEEAILKELGII